MHRKGLLFLGEREGQLVKEVGMNLQGWGDSET